jgi:Leucine-rich repeat (LRR) protein
LQATPNAPETWKFATWNDETPKKITKLMLLAKFMKGEASFSELITLDTLYCDFGYLTKLDVTNCTQLKSLSCMDNYLTEINLTHYKQLQDICFSKNKLSKFDISNCTQLEDLDCYRNNLTELDVRNCKQLKTLSCYFNNLTELDVTNCTQLVSLKCHENKLIALDLSKSGSLQYLQVGDQKPLPFTLYENESGTYSLPLNLNFPVFGNTAINYENGVLKSNDNTVDISSFSVQTNKLGYTLDGTMFFNYSDVGIDTMDENQLKIYPNPTTGELIVTSNELRVTSIKIFDINGCEQKAESRKQKAEGEIVIDISHLSTGIYFVKIITEQGEIIKKIVKQ